MALAQSQAQVINRLRRQYMSLADDEQSKRIIRAYPIGHINYQDEDFNYILDRIESPPIPINVLEDGQITKRLNSMKEHQDILEESAEEEEDAGIQKQFEEMHEKSMVETVKNSVATLKIDVKSFTPNSTNYQRKPPPTSSKYFSKLFRGTSSNSTIDARRASSDSSKHTKDSDDDEDEDDDDDDDGDDDDDDDDDYDNELTVETGSVSTKDGEDPSQINIDIAVDNSSKLQVDESDDHPINRSGIFVDRHTSDVNSSSHSTQIESKYFYVGDNTPSFGDDDMLLDSDFSDDDDVILDTTFESSELPSLTNSRSSSKFTPSKFVNSVKSSRKLSFDKVRPRARSKRGDSLASKPDVPTENEVATPKSEGISGQIKPATFEKVNIEPQGPVMKSKLSALIRKTNGVDDPLEYYTFASARDITNRYEVLNLKVSLPEEKRTAVKIRKNIKVFEAIGFILLTLTKDSPEFFKSSKLRDPNRWCMKLIDEDGEPYEGTFGLMDRMKSIGSYGEDEVALLPVSEAEFRINEIRTPTPRVEEPSNTSTNSSPQKPTGQNTYYKSIIPVIDNDNKDSRTVEIFVYEYPANVHPASFLKFEFELGGRLNEVLVKYCKAKSLDQNDYVLKAIDDDYILDLNDSISSLDGGYKLEILTKRKARGTRLTRRPFLSTTLPTINSNLTPQTLVVKNQTGNGEVQEAISQQQTAAPPLLRTTSLNKISAPLNKHNLATSFRQKNGSKTSLRNQDSMLPNSSMTGYQNFTVWRRQPMSFMNRHERTFAIDGDYIYITPNDEKNWYETNFKRTTIHVSQLISCKVSKRVPANFKMLVMKPKGPKRYDFEAVNAEQANEIINILKTLMRDYKINSASVS